jgi:thiamine-phosphate pyrophosphorylase
LSRINFDLYLITGRHQTAGRPLKEVLGEALAGGVRAVQLREKDLPVRELLSLAFEIRELTLNKALLLINDRADVCLSVGADGVHLRSDSLPPSAVRKMIGPNRLIGVSCHSLGEASFAEAEGADFITLGPLFFTPSKSKMGTPLGLVLFKSIVEKVKIPVFGLGGIQLSHLPGVMEAGAGGIALISAILTAPSVKETTRDFLTRIKSSKK